MKFEILYGKIAYYFEPSREIKSDQLGQFLHFQCELSG